MVNTLLSNVSEFLDHGHKLSEIEMGMLPDYPNYVRNRMKTLFWDKALELVHTDHRRSIHEYNDKDYSLQQFEVFSWNRPLGNHFHKKGKITQEGELHSSLHPVSEIFLFDEGSKGILLLQDLDETGAPKVESVIQKIWIATNKIIVIKPFQAHTFFLEPGTKFRWFRPYPFDKDDMDLNPYKLELPVK